MAPPPPQDSVGSVPAPWTHTARPVPVLECGGCDEAQVRRHFDAHVQRAGRTPLLLRGLAVGACVGRWTPDYLAAQLGGRQVTVHACRQHTMVFAPPNFRYCQMSMGELLRRCTSPRIPSSSPSHSTDLSSPALENLDVASDAYKGREKSSPPSGSGDGGGGDGSGGGGSSGGNSIRSGGDNSSGSGGDNSSGSGGGSSGDSGDSSSGSGGVEEFYYMRALHESDAAADSDGSDGSSRKRQPTRLERDFPEVAGDFQMPRLWSQPCDDDNDSVFSSVLRISSPRVRLWAHYDTLDNVLVQVCGSKRLLVFRPRDAGALYVRGGGDKSAVPDLEAADVARWPLLTRVQPLVAHLRPGDALYLPALWLHSVTAHHFSVAVNVFWRHLPASSYPAGDVFGNKDPLAAAQAVATLQRALRHLKQLPPDYRDFYGRRMIAEIEQTLLITDEQLDT